jgi:hypothetical protein
MHMARQKCATNTDEKPRPACFLTGAKLALASPEWALIFRQTAQWVSTEGVA